MRFLQVFLTMGITITLLGCISMNLAACGSKAKPKQEKVVSLEENEEAKELLGLQISRLRQYSSLGGTAVDGQAVVLDLLLTSHADIDIEVPRKTITLLYQNAQGDTYRQGSETIPFTRFKQQFGPAEAAKLFPGLRETLHPQLPTDRRLVFVLPNNADFSHYTLQARLDAGAQVLGGAFGAAANSASTSADKLATPTIAQKKSYFIQVPLLQAKKREDNRQR